MAQQIVNVGASANDGTGDTLRASQQKANANFTELYGIASGASSLQAVTDIGNTTDNNIEFSAGVGVLLDNASTLRKGTIDAGYGGAKGISQICSVGYELKWEAGRLYVMNDGGTTIREVSHNFNTTPSIYDDVTKGFIVGSRWILDNGDLYICTDNTIIDSVWELQIIGSQDLQSVTTNGNTTTNTVIVGNLTSNYSQISPTDIGTENNVTGTYAFLGNTGELGLNNGSFESNLKNTNVNDDAVILEFPSKVTGSYIIATTEDIPTNTSDLTNDSNFVSDAYYVHTDNNFTSTLKTKLDGIADGAEVNVNADWNATSGDAQILNKPTIPSISGLELQANKQNSLTTDGTGIKYPTVDAVNAGILDINTNAIDRVTVKLSVAINKGQAVYVSGANGTNILVSKASNTSESTSSKTIGLLETTGAINAIVNVVTDGLLTGLNTFTATIGDPVWLGTNGDLIYGLASKPYAPAHLVYIGVVTRVSATVGEILVKVQNGFELSEIHNVLLTSPADNDLLIYENSTSLWKNKTITAAMLPSAIDAAKIDGGNVSNTEFSYLDGVTSSIQTQIDTKASIIPRLQNVTSSATVTPTSLNDLVTITAQAAGLTIANPTGTMTEGQSLMIRIKDNGTARSIAFGTNYRALGITLPTTTTISKTMYLGLIWNNTDTKFDVVGLNQEA